MFWETPLCGSSQCFLYHLAGRSTHGRVANLVPSDQASVQGLRQRLENETSLYCTRLNQIENLPQRPSEPEALGSLYVALGEIGVVQDEYSGNFAVAPEIGRNGHVQLCRIQIRQIVKGEHRLVTVYTLDFLVPIPGPQRPKYQLLTKPRKMVFPKVRDQEVGGSNPLAPTILFSTAYKLNSSEKVTVVFGSVVRAYAGPYCDYDLLWWCRTTRSQNAAAAGWHTKSRHGTGTAADVLVCTRSYFQDRRSLKR